MILLMTVNHIIYLTISVVTTVVVASTLHKHARPFLVDVFSGNERVGDAVNSLLVVGFYLLNVGLVAVMLKYGELAFDIESSLEVVSSKFGLVLLILGGMHFFNVFVCWCIRAKKLAEPLEIVEFREGKSG
jgi:uncharacterized membrane protein